MPFSITASFKEQFIGAVISANQKLFTYINNELKKNDFLYSNTIGFGGDNSLNIDLFAENIFIEFLSYFGNIYSEERGFVDFNKDYTIVIDPIDGSNNFYSNLPYYGSSVALKKDNQTIAGFVTNFVNGIVTYRAFGGDLIYYSLIQNKIIIPFIQNNSNLAIFEKSYAYPEICNRFFEEKIKYRTLGAAALSLCDARKYKFVLYCGNIRDFDVDASLYICSDMFIYKEENKLIIAKTKDVLEKVKEIINFNRL